jgi:amino acid adenylation domain-containing protein/non-ribosomal peptide synthase protein (TIGR01720 family)
VPSNAWSHTALELTALAAQLLDLPALQPSEQLFARGVDSVACMRLVGHVRERFAVPLELRDVFEAPELWQLAERIDALRADVAAVAVPVIPEVSRARAWPLSAAQLRMWLLSSLAEAELSQHVAGGLRITGVLDRGALNLAAERLGLRHESLRTIIEAHAGVPAQRVLPALPVQVRVLQDATLDDAACVRAAAEPAFDLAHGPLWRLWLYERGPQDHLLVLCMHHVISDGWSMELAARELLQLYAAEVEGRVAALPALAVQLVDYVQWEAEESAARCTEQLAYWRTQLGGELPPLELPRKQRATRGGRAGRAGRTVAVELEPTLIAKLRALSAAQHTSLFAVLLAGFQLWLSRMTGREQIRVGVPVLGRQHVAAEPLIGCFVNTVVLQLQVEPRSDVATLVRTVDAQLRAALAHADVPFETLVRALAPERSAEHTPLFQVTYNHLRVSEPVTLAGLHVERVPREVVGSPFELSLETEEFADGRLRAIFNYPVETFAYETVCELAQSFVSLLAQLSDVRELAEVRLLSAEALARFSAPYACESRLPDLPAHELIVQQAQRFPERLAIVGAGERWTYAQLERSSRALAVQLRARGVGPDVQVGIYVPRGPRMLVAALGVLRAGGAYVPLDMSYPAARLSFILRDAGLTLVLSESAADRGSDWPDDVVCLALPALLADDRDAPLPALPVHPAQLAYVIYTSGSTGQPKGVGVGHGSLQMHLRAIGALYEIDERDCALQFSSFSFDAAVENSLMPLTHGARLVLSDAEGWTGEQTYQVVQREHVTIVFPPTVHLRLLAQHVLEHTDTPAGTPVLRAVCVGGEAVLREDHALIMRALAPERFINGYGPTECVVTPLAWRSFARETPEQSYAPIGRPVGARRVYVLDAELAPVPVGVIGEVYIAGGHARGYHARPALTAESFVPDPFSDVPGGRLYRTGDLGRWLASGDVEYVARRDGQIKLRGFRIELGEIESCLRQFPDVLDAVVVLHEDATGQKRLVGYVEAPDSADLNALRAHASAALPEYMVPAQLIALGALPKSPNGKVDRRALPQPEAAESSAYVAPESETEHKLAQVWSDVLGVPRVGLDDNFFELGGDSIIALQVVSRARQLGLRLWPKQLFQHQTLRALCAAGIGEAAAEVPPEPEQASFALTPIQRRFVAAGMPVPSHYNQAIVLRVAAGRVLEPGLLANALRRVAAQHDALRLRFSGSEQHYAPVATWPLSVLAEPLSTEAYDEVQRGFDLEHGPVCRALLGTSHDGSQRLLLAAHHLVIDAVSWRVLIEDLAQVYGQIERGEPSILPARTSSFRSWSLQLQQHDASAELPYWRAQLGAAELPSDVPGASLRAGRSATLMVALSATETSDLLRRVPEAYRTRVDDVLLTALSRVLCRWAGRSDISIALEGHGREPAALRGAEDIDLSRTVGWFTSLYPVRLCPELGDSTASLGRALQGVKEQLRAVPGHGLGYGVLQQLAAAELPRVSFNYLGQVDQTLLGSGLFALSDEASGALQHEDNPLGHWLSIDGLVSAQQLSLQFRYSADMYRAETITQLAEAFRHELVVLIAHATHPAHGGVTPSDFPLLSLTQAQLDALPLPATEIEDLYPLSPLQHGMLFHSLFERGERAHALYVSQLALDVQGLDLLRFAEVWREAVARHEVLRTAFLELEPGAGFVQLVHKRASLQVAVHDCDLGEAARIAQAERDAGFVLDRPPLLRLTLLQLPDARQRVIVTHHHVLLDGWSLTRLFEEVLRGYAGERVTSQRGSYQRYIAWLAARDVQADCAFWSERLPLLEEPSLLLAALPRTAAQDNAATSATVCWNERQSAAFMRFAKRERVTVNTVVQAAWAVLLQRQLGRDTVAFGVTVAGRPASLPDAQTAVGLFINTVPLVVQPAPELQVGDWLRAVQRENVALREHEHTALADVQRWAGSPGQALFDSLVVFENYPVDRALRERGGEGLSVLGFESLDRTSYALTVEARLDKQLSVQLKSEAQQLSAAQLEQLGAQLSQLMAAVVAAPERRLGELSLSGERERAQLAAWNDTRAPLVDERLVHELIDAAAQHHPDAIAVTVGDTRLSYAALRAHSQQLACYLRARGLGPGSLVAVCAERSLELVVALFAVLKAGAAYLPLDPSYPRERMQVMLEDSGAQLLLTQARLLPSLPPAAAEDAFCLDRDWAVAAAYDAQTPLPALPCHAEQLAYVIYTSGSTGKPKGVELTHAGFRNYVSWALGAYRLAELDVSALHSSIAFDLTVTSLWLPLCAGKRVALVPESGDALAALAQLLCDLDDSGARSLLKITPSHALALSTLIERPLPNVRAWIVGGEALSWECSAALQRLAPGSRVINEYGPTETVVGCAVHDASVDHTSGRASSVPIGTTIANMQLYVLDAALQPVPAGVTGELYIGGVALARGYRGRPALTAERFVPHPLAHGERLYRTGDLARYRDDGVLEYLGRTDHQIKLRGYRIELGEIEAALRDHSAVGDAVAIAVHEGAATKLVGYVAAPGADAVQVTEALLAKLRARLPAYMVPAQLIVLDALPLTGNGKIDRRALPAVQRSTRVQRAAASPLEQQLLEIWRSVLGAPDAGVEDDFFELGGDSLLSLQIISRARALGVAFTAKQLFEARCVAQLAAVAVVATRDAETSAIARVSRDGWLPLSHAQERMWFLAQLEPDSAAYNVSGALRLRGALDVAQLEAAFAQLVARHEALRTSFEEQDGRGMQRVHAHAALVVRKLSVRGPEAEQRARDAFAAEASTPFRLADKSLLRLLLIALSDRDHVLVVTMHHLVSDAGTVATLLGELQALYTGKPLPAAANVQYVDYAVWQRSALSASELSRQLDYFRAQLGAEHPVLELPSDRPRPAVQSYRGAGLRFTLDAETSRALLQLGQTLGASTFMVLLAAFESVLYRLTGQHDLRVGIPMSRRSRVELEGVVGLFVNTLVLRSEVSGALTFRGLLDQLKQVSLDAQAHGDLPFERLVEALSPERSLSHNPLFQVMFDHQRAPLSGVRSLGELELTAFDKPDTATQLDLGLETFGDADQIYGSFTYATDLFDHASIELLCARFLRVLRQVVKQPDTKLADLALLDETETTRLLALAEPQLAAADAAQPFVHVHIDQLAAEQPDAIALDGETGEAPWTYARLERTSNQWAARLRELGVGPESKVGLCVSRSPRMVMAALAILKAGAAYVPLDPSYPLARLRAGVVDDGVHCVLGERSVAPGAQLGAATLLCCDVDDVSGYPTQRPDVALHGEHLAYVVYTSGSTGRPKGVGVSHAALAQHVAAIGRDYGMRRDDCALHFASIGFDAGTEQWVSPLVHGARLFIRGDELWSAERALEVLRERKVSWFEMPPGYLHELARAALERGERLQLRACSAGGEAVSRETLLTMLQAVHPAPVINGYGPTETVITPMTWHAYDSATCSTAYAPIGRVIGPRASYVLDADLNLVPVGVTGELYLGGSGLARGYIGRPDLSAERFVPDPFAYVTGARMYRTGDLARMLPDGNVEYIGRADHQVKVRGFRVELGEIEAQLLAQPGVREAVVVADGGAVATRLLAYVAGAVEVEALRAQLRAALPEYMVPAQLIVLAQLPRNSNGKVDRKALPAPEQCARLYEAPRSQLEAQLCAIFAEVLQVERVGRDDDFFELGGDSIRSLQVISRARKIGLLLRPRDMFRCRGVAELAEAVQSLPLEAAAPELRALPRDTEYFRLSYAQERLWFLAQLDPNSAAYNISGAVQVRGPLDHRDLERALATLCGRHEALRTTFEARDGLPWQRVHATGAVALELHDCSAGGPLSAAEQARVLVEAAADAPFDLAHGPLLRVLAVRVARDVHVLCLVMHHIISDGWSLDTAIAELSALYAAVPASGWSLASGFDELPEPAGLPALPVQYVDYASWQRDWLQGDELDRQLDYWRDQLGTEHPVLSLPSDRPRPQRPSQRGDVVDFALDAALSRRLHSFAREQDTTVFVVMLAAFQAVLHRLSGQRDVRVGVPVTNRNRLETEAVIGLFVNTQVLRSSYDPSDDFAQIVARTRETALSAQANQDVPFERLVEALQPARSMGHNPLFQVMYNHLRRTDALFASSPELQAEPFSWRSQWSQFDLTLDSEEDASGAVSGRLTYATDLFARNTAERWAAQFVRALDVLLSRPRAALGTLSWLAPQERVAQLAAAAPRSAVPAADHGLLHERIRAQALRHNSRIACSYDGEQLSYRALELRANQWAQRLVQLGVGPDVLVGLCVERSLDLVVGVLAILKAGGAYVPLDPSAPAERVSYMVEDSRLGLVLTHSPLLPRFADMPGLRVLCLDREDVGAEPTEPPPTQTRPDQLAYVIYTSGSTGKPKGALLTHQNVTRLFDVTASNFAFDERDVWTLFHSYAFDFSVWELFGALLYGGCVVVVPYDVSRSPSDFFALLLRERVTVLNQTPSAFRQLAAVACAAPEADTAALALRCVVFGGEALELEALRPWFERFGDQRPQLINMYGITETTVHVTYRPVSQADLQDASVSPIGAAIDDLSLYVLDEALEPCPWGVTGELYVGGPGLARGYLGRPALSAERFVPNPFGPGRLYRSGDLALRRESGALEYLGRSDHQVKIRGFRIELGEIASQLQAHPSVREASVIARPGPSGQRLLGYVTCHEAHGADLVDTLKQHLRRTLPEYMVPASLIVLDELPLTVNGKLDQARLPEQAPRAASYVPPSGAIEPLLAAIWSELLGVDRVGSGDDFFELGGHSLLIPQVLSRVQRQFGVSLQLRALFETSTLHGLAACIAEASASGTSTESQLDALDALLSDLEDEA